MLAICLTSCLAPGCGLLYVWSLAASTLADLLCMLFDKFTVPHAKSFAGPLLPVPVLLVLCLCPDTQIIIYTTSCLAAVFRGSAHAQCRLLVILQYPTFTCCVIMGTT